MLLPPLFVGVRGALLRGTRGSEEGDGPAEPGRSGAIDEEAAEEDEPPVDIDGRRCAIGLWRQWCWDLFQGSRVERQGRDEQAAAHSADVFLKENCADTGYLVV